jgi:hypothetical protein
VLLSNTGNIVINTDDYAGNSAQWTFGVDGNLTVPGNILGSGNILIAPDSANSGGYLDIYLSTGPDVHIASNGDSNLILGRDDSSNVTVNTDGNVTIQANTSTPHVWKFDSSGNLNVPQGGYIGAAGVKGDGTMLTGGAGNVASLTSFYANGFYAGCFTANPDGNVNITTYTGNGIAGQWTFDTTGNLTLPAGGNLVLASGGIVGDGASPAPYLSGFDSVSAITLSASGNVTGGNLITSGSAGNITMTGGNITGANVVTANSFVGNGATLSNVATTFESTWTVPTGNSTQSFTVTPSNTYYMWVDCNIPNGILTWNATATITNTNVPVVGAQYAWVYTGGGTPIDFTSIPNQFVGTSNTIVRSSTAPSATTNRFDFDINNASGNAVTVRYGWAQIS